MHQHYDVAVIGAQLSGTIAAALLAKRGRRVLLVDHGESAVAYRRRGLRLPLVPRLIPDPENSPAMQRVHEELALGPELRATTRLRNPVFQAVMPRHRFAVCGDRKAFVRELSLEFPEATTALTHFFTKLDEVDGAITTFLKEHLPVPAQTLVDRWRSRKTMAGTKSWDAPFEVEEWLPGLGPDHPLNELLITPLVFFGHLEPRAPSIFQAVRLLSSAFRGAIDFGDRLGGLTTLLQRTAKEAGVDVRRGAEVKSLSTANRSLRELELDGERIPFTADFFIDSTVGAFSELLPAGERAAPLLAQEQAVRPTGSLLVMNFVVHKDVVPCGMAEAVMLLNGRRAPRGEEPVDPPLLLARYPAQRNESSVRNKELPVDSEHEVLSAACPVRTADVQHSPDRFAAIKAQLIERVARVVPFLRDHLRDASLPSDTTSWDLESDAGPRRIDPWRVHPLYEANERPLLGVATKGPRTYFKNMVHAGRDVFPGLGVEGEYLAALAAVATLTELAGKKWQARVI